MKRTLVIANTYYQLIVALQLNYTILKDYNITLLLSDHSKGTKRIVQELRQNHVFSEVYFIKSKGILDDYNFQKKIRDVVDFSFCKTNKYSYYLKNINNLYFDEIICYNYGIDIVGIYNTLYYYNKSLKLSLFEEGILSYNVNKMKCGKRDRLVAKLRHILGKSNVTDSFKNFYCFYPSLYNGTFNAVEIPHINSESECTKVLKKVFDIENLNLQYNQKYIFFTSVYDFEGGEPIREYELVCKIADLVGKDNLLVKTHPRDTRTIYTDNGFNVDVNSSIPWEVIQLSKDFSDKVFMTVNSGSVLAGSFMSEKPVRTYYMYKLCDISGNKSCQINAKDIEKLLKNDTMKDTLKNVKIANKLEDIL